MVNAGRQAGFDELKDSRTRALKKNTDAGRQTLNGEWRTLSSERRTPNPKPGTVSLSAKIRLPMEAFTGMVSAAFQSRHSSAGRAADL